MNIQSAACMLDGRRQTSETCETSVAESSILYKAIAYAPRGRLTSQSSKMAALRKVGLVTHTGQISSHIYRNLLGPNNDRKIDLVVLHRPKSDTSSIPANVETRTLDLEQSSDDAVKTAVQDLNVIV